jgi:hypothetical protein
VIGPDLRVLVEEGQWAAVVQLYDAVWSGRVNGNAFVAKDTGPITIKPIEISKLKIPPVGAVNPEDGRHAPARRNKAGTASL